MEKINNDDIEMKNEQLTFNPYNNRNVLVKENDIKNILKYYGLPPIIYNFSLYKRAFVHKSYVKKPKLENIKNNIIIAEKPDNCLPLKTKSNERLEFLGDGILECISKFYLYRRFPKENEGFMTEKKISLVKNEAIGKIAYDMGLNRWLIISKNAEEKKIRTNLKKLGCLFESFLGALFLDMNKIKVNDSEEWFKKIFVTGPGFQMVQKFLENVFEKHINWKELLENSDNYKNILQILLQKEFKTTPIYKEIGAYDDEQGYNMGVFICLGEKIYNIKNEDIINFITIEDIKNIYEDKKKICVLLGSSQHKIKKKAEQKACELIIKKINKKKKLI